MKLKQRLMGCLMAAAAMVMLATPMESDAKRLGGGRASGMQRQMPAKQVDRAPDSAPANGANNGANAGATNQATAPGAAAAAGAAGAQAGRRSWMGPIAGIAAGLGIAALMSHLGMGEAFGNFLTMALVALLAVVVIGWLMKRFSGAGRAGSGAGAGTGGLQLAGAGMGAGAAGSAANMRGRNDAPVMARQATPTGVFAPREDAPRSSFGGATQAAPVAAAPATLPEGVDAAGFERIAKMIFIRLQAANDQNMVDDIRKFTTPELFASLRLDLQERGGASQQTDVVQLDAKLVDTVREADQWVASVRFSGLIREAADEGAQPFEELWHLVKPVNDEREWAIAGITPLAA